jgi:hypothetical protein
LEEPCLVLKPARRSELLDQLRRLRALGAPEASWGGTGIAAFVGAVLMITLQRKIWPAQVGHA